MQVTYNKSTKELTIVVKAGEPRRSKSGNTMLVASETQKQAVDVNGNQVTIALNAYFKE